MTERMAERDDEFLAGLRREGTRRQGFGPLALEAWRIESARRQLEHPHGEPHEESGPGSDVEPAGEPAPSRARPSGH
jgi:hypothetical protein